MENLRYQIISPDPRHRHVLELTEEDFYQIRSVREYLSEALVLEELFDIVLENYVEFEQELLTLTLKDSLFFSGNWSERIGNLHRMNRRLMNLLSTCRLYLDKTQSTLKSMFDESAKQAFKDNTISPEYDSRLGYRVMEALRNYVQHYSLPAHNISYNSGWNEHNGQELLTTKTTISLRIERLEEDKKFKRDVLEELKQHFDSQVDIKPLVRDYITGITKIHISLRQELTSQIQKWEKTYLDPREKYHAEANENPKMVFVVALNSAGNWVDEFSIFEEIISRRKMLEHKNRSFGDLTKNLITTE